MAKKKKDKPEPEVQKSHEELASEYLAGWQRALADYENLKREAASDRLEFTKYATTGLIEDLLPTLDYFEAAIEHVPDLSACEESSKKSIESWLEGVRQVRKLMIDKLVDQGLTEIETTGELDTSVHEAVEEIESEEPAGTIIKVIQKGYKLHDKLLRPAKVVVSKSE